MIGGYLIWHNWWTTEADFDYSLKPLVVLEGARVWPNDFLSTEEYMEGVYAEFQNPRLETTPGRHIVPLTLKKGWRSLETIGTMYVLTTVEEIWIEYTEEGPSFQPMEFVVNADLVGNIPFEVKFLNEPLPRSHYAVGQYPIQMTLNGDRFTTVIHVEDTTPPTASPVNHTIPMSEEVHSEMFVTGIEDASPIAGVSYVNEPDVFKPGDQTVEIAVEDIHGNISTIEAILTVLPNTEPPVIHGTSTRVNALSNMEAKIACSILIPMVVPEV